MPRNGYSFAVYWIAYNDEPGDTDPESIRSYISTLLVADIFCKEPETVARDIASERNRRNARLAVAPDQFLEAQYEERTEAE